MKTSNTISFTVNIGKFTAADPTIMESPAREAPNRIYSRWGTRESQKKPPGTTGTSNSRKEPSA
ncbi:hypothetical protein GWI33_007282, partial [Rhynchophorus ferrugineus]